MPDQKITDLSALTATDAATGDLVEVVDVTDTTMAASGTNKKMTLGNLASAVAKEGVVATDAIFDAKGDLAVGTGADTAAKLTVGANGTVLTAASGETTGTKWASPLVAAVFGNGADGASTISGNTTLASDVWYTNLTVDAGVTLTTGGFRVFVSGTLTLNGTIAHNGGNGGTPNGGAGATRGTMSTTVPAGGQATTGLGGAGTSVTNSIGGAGGAGGASTGFGSAAAGTRAQITASRGGANALNDIWRCVQKTFADEASALVHGVQGGSGGGAGGGGSSANGGGGGGGGGVVFVAARVLAGAGALEAKGGNGGNAGGSNNGGGGGGGGGGIILITTSTSNPYTMTVSGGSGGAKTGGGSDGTAGGAGLTFVHLGVGVV